MTFTKAHHFSLFEVTSIQATSHKKYFFNTSINIILPAIIIGNLDLSLLLRHSYKVTALSYLRGYANLPRSDLLHSSGEVCKIWESILKTLYVRTSPKKCTENKGEKIMKLKSWMQCDDSLWPSNPACILVWRQCAGYRDTSQAVSHLLVTGEKHRAGSEITLN